MNRTPVLFLNVLVVATCGLVYELLAGALASYVLGDSVTQFSLVIGIYLSALGVGAWLSGFVADDRLARVFVETELAVALIGGSSGPLLFVAFGQLSFFQPVLYGTVFLIGVLVGLELPLLMRIVRDQLDFKELVARVLAFDYLGALVASVLFPILLVPKLGLTRTSLVFGLLNAAVGLWATSLLRPLLPRGVVGLRARGVLVLVILTVGLVKADALTALSEASLYPDDIVYAKTSPYQRIVVTTGRAGFNLYLNGHLQFASADEYRYHEALVHPALSLAGAPRRVLVLGGGDGLALREVLRYPSVTAVTLVDLDPAMTGLSEAYPPLARLNGHAFADPRVTVVNQDAFVWADGPGEPFDAAVVDFPDPSSYSVGKLYTTAFYRKLGRRLTPGAAVAVQCTSPLFARTAFWCVVRTLEAAGWTVQPYQVAVPSFGVWGFALCRRGGCDLPTTVPAGLRFLTPGVLPGLFELPPDLGPVAVEVNRLDNQVLVRYHEADWHTYEGRN
ncbi:MAG: polyamine aminopropyltransferase [Gemmataceae bacterium]|nr:polyamine aminopropyltransferase [Gemmataceae bacterium]